MKTPIDFNINPDHYDISNTPLRPVLVGDFILIQDPVITDKKHILSVISREDTLWLCGGLIDSGHVAYFSDRFCRTNRAVLKPEFPEKIKQSTVDKVPMRDPAALKSFCYKEDIVDHLHDQIEKAESVADIAAHYGISRQALHNTLSMLNAPAKNILKELGLVKIEIYVKA